MRRSLPTLLALIVVCVAAGVAIAGLPKEGDNFAITRAQVADPTTPVGATSTPVGTDPLTSAGDSTTTTVAESTTTNDQPNDTQAGAIPSTTTGTNPSTTDETSASAEDITLERADVRLVIANGDGRFRLASVTGDRLRTAGYVTIDLTDFLGTVDATILYYRPGFDDEAAIVAADLLVPNAILEPLPNSAVTINDELGDVIIVLGPDAVR